MAGSTVWRTLVGVRSGGLYQLALLANLSLNLSCLGTLVVAFPGWLSKLGHRYFPPQLKPPKSNEPHPTPPRPPFCCFYAFCGYHDPVGMIYLDPTPTTTATPFHRTDCRRGGAARVGGVSRLRALEVLVRGVGEESV